MKNFFIKKMMEKKMKDVPKEEQEKMMKLFTENPELFQKLAIEIKKEMDEGCDQMTASMKVAKRHEEELKGLL